MIDPMKIDHVCLFVSDLDRAKSYYERLFGAECWFRENDRKTLVFETNKVHFFLSEAKSFFNQLSQQHISFQVANLADVISKLEGLGISEYKTGVINFFKHENYGWCEWRDPDGIRLERQDLGSHLKYQLFDLNS